jgi:hypothetical protein
MHASQPYRLFEVMDKVTEIIDEIVDDVSALDDRYEELVCLHPWLLTERFDRRALNKALAVLGEGAKNGTAA